MTIEGKTPWEFACGWYTPDEIERCIAAADYHSLGEWARIPTDINSRKFAEWLTEQYRLAMRKGIELGLSALSDELDINHASYSELEKRNAEQVKMLCDQRDRILSLELELQSLRQTRDYHAGVEVMLLNETCGGDDWWRGWEMVKAAHCWEESNGA